MARNEEKQLGRLNRIYLEKERQEYLKKHPPRPKLFSLNSAEEIKKWLPSIKTDIDFCLKQSQVACYPDMKIEEFSQQIESLSREYKAFLKKLKQLEPDIDVVPWTERAYSNKRKRWIEKASQGDKQILPSKRTKETKNKSMVLNSSNTEWTKSTTEGCETLNFIPLPTAVLAAEEHYKNCYGYNDTQPKVVYNSNPDLMDRPLVFAKQTKICEDGFTESCDGSQEDSENVLQVNCGSESRECISFRSSDLPLKKDCLSIFACIKDSNQTQINLVSSLNLPYSDSSSDETEDQENR